MPNSWLVLITAGLCLDMCGVILLAKPITRNSKNRYKKLYKRLNNLLIQREKFRLKSYEIGDENMHLLSKEVIDLRFLNNSIHDFTVELQNAQDEIKYTGQVVFALIILFIGFFLQIIGNAMKS